MSGHSPSAQKQGKRCKDDRKEDSRDGGRMKVYLHTLSDEQAASLTHTENSRPLEEVKRKTGAEVEFDPNPSPVPGMKILIVCGGPPQIEAAVELVNQKTGSKIPLSAQAQTFWLQWVEAAFPDLDSRAYFLPPVYINRVPMTRQSVLDQDVHVLTSAPGQAGQSNQSARTSSAAASSPQPPPVYDSDVRDDEALQRVLLRLKEMSKQNGEVMIGMSQLQFGQYLGEPCYAAAAAQLPLPASLPSALPQNWKQGDFDVLLIHRQYGIVVCEVKAFGDNTQALNMSPQDMDNNIRKKLKQAVSQLDKAEAMLSHLVSDISPGLRITKTIAFPNLTTDQVQQTILGDMQLTQDLCQCLGTTDATDIAGVCLCSDQLSDPKTPCDVSSHVLRELGHWWQRRVAGAGPDSHMTPELYKTLVARFCGPATTVSVPCTSPPRVSVKTLGQAVWCTGECYTAVITLFPEQLHLLNTAPPRLFVTGPPGTGKTVVLLMTGIKWLRCGHHVYIVSTCDDSRAACIMLYHLMMQTVNTQQSAGVSPGQLHLLMYQLYDGEDTEEAVSNLSQAASGGSLYVIADEAAPHYTEDFKTFCDKLLTQVPNLHLWAATCFQNLAPAGWQVKYLTRPLRSPPAVVQEVKKESGMTMRFLVPRYSERGMPDHTGGPPVRRLYHRGQGHSVERPNDCHTCGREVASFLHSLRVGVTENDTTTSTTATFTIGGTTPPFLQWKDVLVLYCRDISDDSGLVQALKEAGIPVRVMTDEIDAIKDVATARSDVVWVADGNCVQGLERKVVVCLDDDFDVGDRNVNYNIHEDIRHFCMSRCTAQLVIVYRGD